MMLFLCSLLAFIFLTQVSSLPATANHKGSILIIGGAGAGAERALEWYNPWTSKDNRLLKARLSGARWSLMSAVLGDGRVLIAGGFDYADETYLSSVLLFDPMKEKLSSGPPMSTRRASAAAAAVDGVVYVCGGKSGDHQYLGSCERFQSGSWAPIAPMSRTRTGLTMVALDGTLYAIGGFDGKNYSSLVEAYDIKKGSWYEKASMPTARSALSAAVLGQSIIACGGVNDQRLNVCEKYDVGLDTWTTISSMKLNRWGLNLVTVGGRLVAVDGNISDETSEVYDPTTDKWSACPVKPLKWRCFQTAVAF